ncbi:MAG: hypothetical protein ABI480_05830 [Chitinophagaceae bacterium]
MKILLGILCCLFAFSGWCQGRDSCYKDDLAPCRVVDDRVVDTVQSSFFSSILVNLYDKLSTNKELLIEEDRMVVLAMNTLYWSDLFKQPFIENKFPLILNIDTIFYMRYKRILYCKYTVCRGAGFTPYFKELHAQWLGNPFACDRYFIKD